MNPPVLLDAACLLTDAKLELVDGDNVTRIAGPSSTVEHRVTHWILFVPVDFTARANILTAPTGTNMSGTVALGWDVGRTVRVRWRYTFTAPAGVECNPR